MGGSQLDPVLCSQHWSLLSRFSWGSHGHDLLWDWDFELSLTNHCYVLHGRAIWVSRCGVPLPDHHAASSPRDPASWLLPWWWHCTSSKSEFGHCVANLMRLGPGFTCMEHDTPDTRIVNPISGGHGKWAGGEDGQALIEFAPCYTALCDSSAFANRPLRISSPQGNKRMAPPQASPDPMLSSCH